MFYHGKNTCKVFVIFLSDIEGKLHEVLKDDVIEFTDDGKQTCNCFLFTHICVLLYIRIIKFMITYMF